jgi:hypothetical protein
MSEPLDSRMNISELNGSLTKRFENIQNPSTHSLPKDMLNLFGQKGHILKQKELSCLIIFFA